MTVRQVAKGDEEPLRVFLSNLCLEARRLRFFTGGPDLAAASHWAAVTPNDGYGLLAHDEMGRVVGHAAYARLEQKRAEIAVEVADHVHDRGLGTILLARLAAVAELQGITQFVADVLPDNHAMLEVFRDGFDAHVELHEGTETVEFPTSTWRLPGERFRTSP